MRQGLDRLASTSFLILLSCVVAVPALCRQDAAGGQERQFENLVPAHLPIKVVEVRGLQSEHWMRDLEIEVKNTSDRPVYLLRFVLLLPDTDPNDDPAVSTYGVPLRFGEVSPRQPLRAYRAALGAPSIEPGRSYTFKVAENVVKGFERAKAKGRVADSATERVQLVFMILSFGDGTGYQSKNGAAYPQKVK